MSENKYSVSKNLRDNLAVLQEELGFGVTFDLIIRDLKVAHKQAALVFFDGFVNDGAVIEIMKRLQLIPRLGVTLGSLERLVQEAVPF